MDLKEIFVKYRAGQFLDHYDCELLKLILENSCNFRNIYNQIDKYKFKIDCYKIANGRSIKMIWACLNGQCIPLPKGKLLAKKPPKYNHLAAVKSAARLIIEPQIKLYRQFIELPIICPLSGKKLTNWSQIHIDHKIPFSILFENWCDDCNIDPSAITLSGPRTAKKFSDKSLEKRWFDYHLNTAELQAVYKKSNLRKGAKIQ